VGIPDLNIDTVLQNTNDLFLTSKKFNTDLKLFQHVYGSVEAGKLYFSMSNSSEDVSVFSSCVTILQDSLTST